LFSVRPDFFLSTDGSMTTYSIECKSNYTWNETQADMPTCAKSE
jgi:hypothetical protein